MRDIVIFVSFEIRDIVCILVFAIKLFTNSKRIYVYMKFNEITIRLKSGERPEFGKNIVISG